jgi:hypothetical protein
MSAAEAPKSEQIQANVAAALSRLRGELGAASSPVASATPIPMPKTSAEPEQPEPLPEPLPAGPVRMPEVERPAMAAATGVRPFEPILNAAVGSNDSEPPMSAEPLMSGEPVAPKPDLFGRLRADPTLANDRAAASAAAGELKPDSQPDLLSGMEVPPAPPPPLGSFDAEDEVNGRGRRMRNRLMVLVALVVLGGGAAWAWVSSHKTPEGPVPVIAADATPEKVKPTEEGGMQVPNQNVEILNGQSTDQQQETVLPPPEQPVAPPSSEAADQASSAPQAPAITDAPATPEPAPTPPAVTNEAPATTDQSAAPSVSAPAIPSVTAPEPGQTAAAPTPVPAAPEPQTAAPAPAEPTPAPTAVKPAESTPAAPKPAEPTQTAATPTAPATPSVAPTAGGTAKVQLAAVKSEALANTQWAKLQKAHPDLLGALTLNVQKVEVNGGTLFRIQAGPLSKAQAKELCGKLKTQKQDCIVAK